MASPPRGLLRRGRGSPVFLLHGFCSSALVWQATLERLGRHHEVIAPDWPGYGDLYADPPCDSVASMAAYVVGLADVLDIGRFHVVGHSMSGLVVQQLMLDHGSRVDHAVLYGTCLSMRDAGRFESADETVARLLRDGVSSTVERIASTWFAAGAADPAYPDCVTQGKRMSLAAAVAAMKAFADVDYCGRLAHARVPSLVIAGDRERTAPPETAVRLARELPLSSLCIVPGCAHAVHLEQPDLFHSVLLDFFQSPS